MKRKKLRGSRGGKGARKRKRGHGNKGGFGSGGTGKRGQQKGHFKKGTIGFNSKIKKPNVITLRELDVLIKKNDKKEIDLTKLNIQKIIGTGTITVPIKIKVKQVTKGAKEKIEKIGGKVELV